MGVRQKLPAHENVCHAVVEAVAHVDNTSPTALQPPLYEIIDPEALETLVALDSSPHDLSRDVGFIYGEYEVRISADTAGDQRTITVMETGSDVAQSGHTPIRDHGTGETH